MGTASYSSSSGSDTSSILDTGSSPADGAATDESPLVASSAVASSQPLQPQATAAATTPSHTPRIRDTVPTVVSSSGVRLVPRAFQHCEMADIIALTAHMLDRIIAHNDSLPSDRPLTRFHSKAAPAITPHAYLTRITTFTNVDPCIIIILLYYIDRLSDYLMISSLTIHRFLISAICCGSKALSDSFATNSRYARVGGVDLVEMNALEREFLLAINWRLATSGAMLEQYWLAAVENHPGYHLHILPPLEPAPVSAEDIAVSPAKVPLHSQVTTTSMTPQALAPVVPDADGRPSKRPKSNVL